GGSAVETYHPDELGSARALSDAGQTVVQRYETDEFGVPTTTTGSSTQPFRYTGQQYDAETGFLYLRARMYDPQLGRFLQRDRWLGDMNTPPSLNRYSYVLSNPATLRDPSGLKSLTLTDLQMLPVLEIDAATMPAIAVHIAWAQFWGH